MTGRTEGRGTAKSALQAKKSRIFIITSICVLVVLLIIIAVLLMPKDEEPIDGISETRGDTVISLTSDSHVEIYMSIKYDDQVDTEKLSYVLQRDTERPYLNGQQFPSLVKGAEIGIFGHRDGAPIFTGFEAELVEPAGEKTGGETERLLRMSFDAKSCFAGEDTYDMGGAGIYSAPHGENTYMDLCGYYNLVVSDAKGTVLGQKPLKIVPYESFRTMEEINAELDAMCDAVVGVDAPYLEKKLLGKSTSGKDISYLIVSDSKESVDRWMEVSDLAEREPQKVLDMAQKGQLDEVRVPVVISNIHSNEIAAADGIMNFAWKLVRQEKLDYRYLTGFTAKGEKEIADERGSVCEADSLALPYLVSQVDGANLLGYIKDENVVSGPVDLEKFYTVETRELSGEELLKHVFFVIVPTQNVDGREGFTREAANGYDLNRDAAFQTTSETSGMAELIGIYNPVSFVEMHGRVESFQVEPCTPPHQPNFEYDLMFGSSLCGGQAFGNAAAANNDSYNSFEIPARDFLYYTGEKTDNGEDQVYWEAPWDDASVGYTPQLAMLHGIMAYTVELPAYNEESVKATTFGLIGHADYIAKNKAAVLFNKAKLFQRGKTNHNSNSMDEVGAWFVNQNDLTGAEAGIMRRVYGGEGENGNFYPECYVLPLSQPLQGNVQDAKEMIEWLLRNDVEVSLSDREVEIDGVTYPAGTALVSMYQAKRSVANCALGKGNLISTWSLLYSESTVNFPDLRGFDVLTVSKKAVYDDMASSGGWKALELSAWREMTSEKKSFFSGTADGDVIIVNSSTDAVAAVNRLLKDGKRVGFVTGGQHAGNFVCSYSDYQTVSAGFEFSALGVDKDSVGARRIKGTSKVYVTGNPGNDQAGFIHTSLRSMAYNYNYDLAALEMMGFGVTDSLKEADVMLGGSAPREDEAAAIFSGTPYLGYGEEATGQLSEVIGARRVKCRGALDVLGYVTYTGDSLITASYRAEGDDLVYGMGASFFKKLPSGAKPIVVSAGKDPVQGFVPLLSGEQKRVFQEYLDGATLAFEFSADVGDGTAMDMVLFANSLTSKVHQRDELAFISNFIFSRALGEAY